MLTNFALLNSMPSISIKMGTLEFYLRLIWFKANWAESVELELPPNLISRDRYYKYLNLNNLLILSFQIRHFSLCYFHNTAWLAVPNFIFLAQNNYKAVVGHNIGLISLVITFRKNPFCSQFHLTFSLSPFYNNPPKKMLEVTTLGSFHLVKHQFYEIQCLLSFTYF